MPSVTGTDAESELQHTVARWCKEAGLEVDTWALDLDALRTDPDSRDRGGRPKVTAWSALGSGTDSGLVLQGHVNVVPVGDVTNWPDAQPFSASIERGASTAAVPAT